MTRTLHFPDTAAHDLATYPEHLVRLESEAAKTAHHLLILGSFAKGAGRSRDEAPYRLLVTSTLWSLQMIGYRISRLHDYAVPFSRATDGVLRRASDLVEGLAIAPDVERLLESFGQRHEVIDSLLALRRVSQQARESFLDQQEARGASL